MFSFFKRKPRQLPPLLGKEELQVRFHKRLHLSPGDTVQVTERTGGVVVIHYEEMSTVSETVELQVAKIHPR